VWARTRLTWVDERCVPVASADSNRGAVLRSGALATAPAVTLGLVEDGESVAQSLVRVDAALRDDFADGLDVTLLGIGPDGHIASLFPGRPWGDGRVLHVADSPKPPPSRLTLTRRLLATAPVHVLMAGGEAKRDALLRLSRADPSLPATGLAGLVIVTDQSGGEPWAT
jgi:6-phosphogluconolactonase